MKILFISHYSELLGANRSLLGLVEGLIAKGEDCTILCRKSGDFTAVLEEKKIAHTVIPFQNWADTFLFPGFWLLPLKHLRNKQLMPQLKAFVEGVQPDIIHTNSSVAPVGAYLSEELNIPHVWHIREFGKLHYNMRFFPSHDNMIQWMKKATKVITISKAIQKEVIRDHFDQWELVYNGVLSKEKVLKLQKQKEVLRQKNSPFRFLNIGMIHPKKNQMEVLIAFHKLLEKEENIELHFVGSGRKVYTQQLKSYVAQNTLDDKVIFHGFVKKPESIYLESDALVMCAKYEGMGRVTAEAMAYAKPVIGYNSGATPELVDHESTGLIYNSPSELIEGMEYLVKNKEKAKEMGLRGREKALAEFTVDSYVNNVYKIYKEILSDS